MKKFGIIGAGNGGQSIIADLVLKKVKVSGIYDCNPDPILAIKKQGGIRMVGSVLSGFVKIPLATKNIEEIVKLSDVLLIAVPATAHETLAKQLAPYLRPNQLVVLFPGYVGGTIIFRRILDRYSNAKKVILAEAISMPYATRLVEPACVGIKARKIAIPVASFPSTNTAQAVKILKEAFPEVIAWKDVLSIGLNNPNPTVHVTKYIFNLGRIESPESFGADFHSWKSPTVDKIEQKFETERLSVIRKMGLKILPVEKFQDLCYGGIHYKPVSHDYDQNLPPSASQVPVRFIEEDVPMGLVPLSGFGKIFGVPTPTIDFLINVASFIRETDYRKMGRTPEYLGLAGMSVNQIGIFIKTGAV